jgi:subtilisin family serine protease
MQGSLPYEFEYPGPLPEIVYGYVSVVSRGGRSLYEARPDDFAQSTEAFHGSSVHRREARRVVERVGLQALAESPLGVAVVGPPGAFEELTGGRIERRERLLHAEAGRQRYVTHLDIVGQDQPAALGLGVAASASARIDAVLLERPKVAMGVFPSPIPPSVSRFHLRVPDDVALGVGATGAHQQGVTGEGVVVAMVDTGHFRHPFFTAHNYNIQPAVSMIAGADPTKDVVGHGTGESANLFAVAPGVTLRPYRAADNQGHLVAAIAGFLRAKQDRPAVITNSWGGDDPYPPSPLPDAHEIAWALEIRHAVEQGIVVVFSGGNGQFSVEPQVPGVIAAGGTYMTQDLSYMASDYASGYASPWFPNVQVPTVCGLVGLRPRAQYLMLPIQPNCIIDVDESQPSLPDDPSSDGTTSTDGWALFSGTSAAAPQVAGAAALLCSLRANLTPAEVTQALSESALDITAGRCHPRLNFVAGPGRDLATGFGLINASAAVDWVRPHP